jgi:hypothetical protein
MKKIVNILIDKQMGDNGRIHILRGEKVKFKLAGNKTLSWCLISFLSTREKATEPDGVLNVLIKGGQFQAIIIFLVPPYSLVFCWEYENKMLVMR